MNTTVALGDLAQRIAQQQSELETLRREFEDRQKQLADLQARKKDLKEQLQQVQAEIRAVAAGDMPRLPVSVAPSPAPTPTRRPAGKMTLPDLLVDIVRSWGKPIRVQELAEEVVRRQYRTTSKNIPALITTRIRELVKQGLLRRRPKRGGVVPGKLSSGPAAEPAEKGGTRKRGRGSNGRMQKGQPSLRSILTSLLEKTTRPMPAKDLAGKVLATGYQTRSKKFVDVLWVALGSMPNVENVQGQGYRLVRSKD